MLRCKPRAKRANAGRLARSCTLFHWARKTRAHLASQQARPFFMPLLHASAACFCRLRDFVAEKRRHSVQLLLRVAVTCANVAALRVRRMALRVRRPHRVPLCQRQRCTWVCFAAHRLRFEVVPKQKAVPQSCGLPVRVPVLTIARINVTQTLHQRLVFQQTCGWVFQAPLAAEPTGNF